MTKIELINALVHSPHPNDTEVYVYAMGEREEDDLDTLEEEVPIKTSFLDIDITDRLDINF